MVVFWPNIFFASWGVVWLAMSDQRGAGVPKKSAGKTPVGAVPIAICPMADRDRRSIVGYLRTEAATLLWLDQGDMTKADRKRVDDAVTLLEAYADAVEEFQDIDGEHPLLTFCHDDDVKYRKDCP